MGSDSPRPIVTNGLPFWYWGRAEVVELRLEDGKTPSHYYQAIVTRIELLPSVVAQLFAGWIQIVILRCQGDPSLERHTLGFPAK